MRPPPSLWERSHNEGYANFEIMGREEPSLSFHTWKDGQGFPLSSHNFGFHRRACGWQRLRV